MQRVHIELLARLKWEPGTRLRNCCIPLVGNCSSKRRENLLLYVPAFRLRGLGEVRKGGLVIPIVGQTDRRSSPRATRYAGVRVHPGYRVRGGRSYGSTDGSLPDADGRCLFNLFTCPVCNNLALLLISFQIVSGFGGFRCRFASLCRRLLLRGHTLIVAQSRCQSRKQRSHARLSVGVGRGPLRCLLLRPSRSPNAVGGVYAGVRLGRSLLSYVFSQL